MYSTTFYAADQDNNVLFLNTVTDNCEGFMQREYESAQEAQKSMHLLGLLSEKNLNNMVL